MKTSERTKDRNGSKPNTVSKKMKWTAEEDEILVSRIEKYGTGNWSLIAQELAGRTGKQCRERWTNQLNPNLNRENWTPSEDRILLQQQQICGNSWSKIAMFLPGRSSNSVKNRWSWLVRHRVLPSHPPTQTTSAHQQLTTQSSTKQRPQPIQKATQPIQKVSLQVAPTTTTKVTSNTFDPFSFDSFDTLPLWIPGSSDIFISDFDQPDIPPYDLFEKGLSLWDAF